MKKLLYILILLAICNTALAATSWTVEYLNGKFKISRSGDTSASETVQYRTVSLSALAGQHFTAKSGTETFGPGETYKEISVTENTPGVNAYKYQNGTSRKYRFEVLDLGGFRLAYTDRSIESGTNVPSSNVFAVKDVTIQSGEYTADDDGYDVNGYKSVSSSNYFNNAAPKAYLQHIGAELRMTLSLQAKENDDAYEYLQLLVDNTSTCDNRSDCSNGDPGNISLSKYMAGFEMHTSSKDDTYRSYTFPVLSVGNNEGAGNPWGYGTQWPLSKQKFNGNRATDGRIIIPTGFNTLVLRLNASGSSGSDEWAAKNVVAHIQAVDGTSPTRLSAPVISGGMHAKGNTFYVSIPFSEIVIVSGTPSVSTTWGTASYISDDGGSGSNVLTFSGTITAGAGTSLTVQSISTTNGTIKDLAGNAISLDVKTINKALGVTVDASHAFSITYDLAGGTVDSDNPTEYTWETAAFTLNNPTRLGYYFDGWTGSNGVMPQTTVTISNHSHVNRSYTANWTKAWTGSGTLGDPYVISTRKGLDLLAMYVNGLGGNTPHNCSGVYFRLGGDITYVYATAWDLASSTENNYTAIGTNKSPFQGTFDGQGYTISGIRIYKSGVNLADENQGIFAKIGEDGSVSAVNLADARITGYCNVGGIAGSSFRATIEGCTVADNVCIHSLQANSDGHGGIVGFNQGDIYRCISKAILTVSDSNECGQYGAITGHAQGEVKNCIAIGAIIPDVSEAGALIGRENSSSLQNNYYRSCSVAGAANATGVGVGYSSGNNLPHDHPNSRGAQALYSLTLPAGFTLVRSASATLPGTGNKTYTTGADIDGTPYAYEGATLTISYTGDAAAQGYSIAVYVNGVQAPVGNNGTFTGTMPAEDATVTFNMTPIPWSGSGTKAEPWQIQYPSQLGLLATRVNGGTNYNGKYFELANDISFSHTTDWDDATSTENNYTPIGNGSRYFQGSFDGRGHTISGIRIYDDSNAPYKGLFGVIGSSSTVQRVRLADMRITGPNCVGSVAGTSTGTIINCHATATVCINAVQNNTGNHGGIVGIEGTSTNSQITGCISAAKLTLKEGVNGCFNWGGIAGYHNTGAVIWHNLAIGVELPGVDEVGAIAGLSSDNSNISKNFFHDCTIGDSAATVGYTYNDAGYSPAGQAEPGYTVTCGTGITATVVSNSNTTYSYDSMTVYDYGDDHYVITYGGIPYYADGITVTLTGTGSPTAGYQEPFLGYDLNGTPLDGSSFTINAADATVTARWTLKDFESGHAGTEADPYIIYNKEQLNLLAQRVNSGGNYSAGKYFKLGNDIAFDGTENNYTAIGKSTSAKQFKGTFDGDGHTISGININVDEHYQGLFGYVDNGAVKNVTLSNSSIVGSNYIGGIVGSLSGTISGAIVESNVTIGGASDGSSYHGGIVGKMIAGVVQGCISSAAVPNPGGGRYYGGIAGDARGTVRNCLVLGSVISATSNRGVILGNLSGTISNNYYYNCSVNGYIGDLGSGSANHDVTDNDGAVRAVTSATKPAEIGAQIASYPNGLTVYEHGAYYNGTYYLRYLLAGTAETLTLAAGAKNGVNAYWGTFFNSAKNYDLSEGAAAYTLGTDYKLYRVGDNGRTVPKNTAVVIISTSEVVTLVPVGTGNLGIADHAVGGNQLLASDSEVLVSGLSGTPYVLSLSAGEIGFRPFTGFSIPAGKAYYLVVAP